MNKIMDRFNRFYKHIVFCLLVSPLVNSAELTADLYTSAEYTNNVGQVSTKPEEDISQILGLSVVLKENRKRFNADASFNLEEEHYYNNSFSNQTSLTTGFGILNFDIVEEFLDWRTSFTRTEVLKNASDTDTPDNREQRNVFQTGPSISYRINRVSTLGASTNYQLVENSDASASDTKRLDSSVNYNYSFNSTTSFSINSQYNEILDGDGDDELKNININLGFVRQLSHGSLMFNYGRTQSGVDSSDKQKGDFYDINYSQNQLFDHDWIVQYKQDISDTSIGFEREQEGFDSGVDLGGDEAGFNDLATSNGLDVVQQKQLNISVNRVIGSFQYAVSGFWQYETYKVQNNDQKSRGFSLSLTQKVTETLNFGLNYAYSLDEFLDQPNIGKDKTNTYAVEGQYILTKSLDISAFVEYEIQGNSHNMIREYEALTTGFALNLSLL
jgi:hypothetical protein